MKIKLLLILLSVSVFSANAQLIIQNNLTPAELVGTLFSNGSNAYSNIKFNGSAASADVIRDQAGRFYTNFNPTNLGLSEGVILSTGKTILALGPNNDADASNPTTTPLVSDPDLASLTTNPIQSSSVLEFDFVATGSVFSLDYVFASEEYPEYVNTAYNDVFGIFLSGPGISGPFLGNAKNIAVIPNTSVPVAINNINNGVMNAGPCQNCNYFVNNGSGTTPAINTSTQFDGFTTVLRASETLNIGETYHVKFAIANVSDNAWDSAVFLKANSFVTALCAPQDQCMYTFVMYDSFGDGLNGEVMSVIQNGTLVTQLYDYDNTDEQIHNFTVPLCHDYPFELFWNNGGEFPNETGVTILNPFGQTIYDKPFGMGTQGTTLYNGTTDCFNALKTADFDTSNWTLFPNPAKDHFKITLSDPNQRLQTVALYDCTGRKVATQHDFASGNSVDVSQLPSGIYMVEVVTDTGLRTVKKLLID